MRTDAFAYPFRGNGWILILTGSVFLMLIGLLQSIPRAGILLTVFAGGFLGAYFLSVVDSTIHGGEEPPDWPSVNDLPNDIVAPLCRIVGLGLISFGPFIAVRLLGTPADRWQVPVSVIAAFWGASYFPMAVIAVTATDQLAAASPQVVLPAVARTFPAYLADVAGLVLVWAGLFGVDWLASQVPWMGWLLGGPFTVYGILLLARWIGLTYRSQRHRIGWE